MSKNNSVARSLLNETRECYRKALLGVSEKFEYTLPDLITPELVLDTFKEQIKTTLKKMIDFAVYYKNKYQTINLNDPKFNYEFGKMMGSISNTGEYFKSFDFDENHHPLQLFQHAIRTFQGKSKDLNDAILNIWVGENPVGSVFKRQILGLEEYQPPKSMRKKGRR